VALAGTSRCARRDRRPGQHELRQLLDSRDGVALGRGRGTRTPVRVRVRTDQHRLGSGAGARRGGRGRPRRVHLRHGSLPAALRSVTEYVCLPMAIEKLLVANRGEIAARIFRACEEAGIATVAVAAPDDAGAFHTRIADETIPIQSYLSSEEHIRAAQAAGADAIHPGYGFLAENADFAEAVEAAGLVFVGPAADALRRGGDKLQAKRIAQEAGVPVLPAGKPEEVGFPLVVKASAGGGGRGMRVGTEPAKPD